MAERFDANSYPLDPGLRLLEASAGTGKTFALAHLTLRLVTELGHPLETLLVVTYTDAAAEELRSRIGQRLQLALAGLEHLDRSAPGDEAAVAFPDPVLADWCAQRWTPASGGCGSAASLWPSNSWIALISPPSTVSAAAACVVWR